MSIFKTPFSQRKGIVTPPTAVIRETMTQEIINAIGTCYDLLCQNLAYQYQESYGRKFLQEDIERVLWIHFANQRLSEFKEYREYKLVFDSYMNLATPWFRILDLIEFVIHVINSEAERNKDSGLAHILLIFESSINLEFERLNYGYRIVDHLIADITSTEEMQAIETAIANSKDNVREHLDKAIELYSNKPDPDIRNSIKESITALETVCREFTGLTGDNGSLGKALSKLENSGIALHPALKRGFDQFYTYTNSAETGIRHALMDPEGTYVPSKDEAYLMLLQCCTFINYLRMKMSRIK